MVLDVPEELEEGPRNVVFLLLDDGADRLPVFEHFDAGYDGEVARVEEAQEENVEQEHEDRAESQDQLRRVELPLRVTSTKTAAKVK